MQEVMGQVFQASAPGGGLGPEGRSVPRNPSESWEWSAPWGSAGH